MRDRPNPGPLSRPILIISPPRSGSTLLFETLAGSPDVVTPGGESHHRIEQVPGLTPRDRGWSSNRLLAADATPAIAATLTEVFARDLRDRDGRPPRPGARMIEKTPKNALRIPFFDRVWPDAHYVYLYRDARETLSSMIEAWQTGNFRTYPGLPGWVGHPWSLLLVPGWEKLVGKSLPEIVATQWATTTRILLDDLSALAPGRVTPIDYRAFLDHPQDEIMALTTTLGLGWDRPLGAELPRSRYTMSAPGKDKWRRHADAIEAVWLIVAEQDERARAFLAATSCGA